MSEKAMVLQARGLAKVFGSEAASEKQKLMLSTMATFHDIAVERLKPFAPILERCPELIPISKLAMEIYAIKLWSDDPN